MASLRTTESEEKFQAFRKTIPADAPCAICEKDAIRSFKLWKIVPNSFPYDKIASIHHMVVPLRHVAEEGLNEEELAEFKEIKEKVLHTEYEYIIEATFKKKSIPAHFHLHLLVAKE
jgi:hypothetical protein